VLENFGDCFKEYDDAEGCGGVVGGFARLVENYAVCFFQAGRMVAEVDQGGEEVEEDGGVG